MRRCLFVFDVDDTLLHNRHDYTEPLLQACLVMLREFKNYAPSVSEMVHIIRETQSDLRTQENPATGRPYYYSRERFPSGLVQAYRKIHARLIQRLHHEPDPFVERELYAIGEGAFDESRYMHNVMDRAREETQMLVRDGHHVVLLTKGDQTVQSHKIHALRVSGVMFHESHIVENRKDEAFQGLCDLHGGRVDGMYSVGNDYPSDIVAALSLGVGYRGIYIPVLNLDAVDGEISPPAAHEHVCVVLDDLRDFQKFYHSHIKTGKF